jgi:hypothetical protein
MKKSSFIENLILLLHRKGFDHDFKLAGNDLLWVQEKAFLRAGDFSVLEWHRLYKKGKKTEDKIVLGLSVLSQGVKGILIVDPKASRSKRSRILTKKFNELIIESLPKFIIAIN